MINMTSCLITQTEYHWISIQKRYLSERKVLRSFASQIPDATRQRQYPPDS